MIQERQVPGLIPVSSILKLLNGHVLAQRSGCDAASPLLLFLEPGMELLPGYTYLGAWNHLGNWSPGAQVQVTQPVTVILSAPDGIFTLPELPGTVIITDLPLITLYNLLARGLSSATSESVSAFLSDLFEDRLSDEELLRLRTKSLPKPLKAFLSCIVIRREAPPDQLTLNQMLRALEVIFPEDNFAVYREDIVVLHTQDDRNIGCYDWDQEALTAYLHRFHAYAGVSHPTRLRKYIRTLWQLASETAQIGHVLPREDMSDCIFAYQDYGMYYIIDLCAARFSQLYGHDNLIYLAHPAIIAICRYDAEHDSNLRDVLFYYLLSHCSLNRTAQRLYMHRNTVLNKLNKITEITQLSLEDGYLQVYLIFSCLIVRYYEQYLGGKMQF